MGQFFDEIPERLFTFIKRSHLFFVATAPLEGGSVNVSPKSSAGAFEIIDKNRVRYLDFTGSGNETISHLLQPNNGRITIMFVNIESGAPNIIRLYGKGTVHEKLIEEPESRFKEWLPIDSRQPPPGTRAVIDIAVHTCSTSCGYSVPIYEYKGERNILRDWATNMQKPISDQQAGKATMKKYNKQIPNGDLFTGKDHQGRPAETWLEAYWVWNNSWSIDGLPGLNMSSMMADKVDRERLLEKKQIHDRLEPPKGDVGPFRSNATTTTTITSTITQTKPPITYMILAFSAGCALTASVFLAPRLVDF